ncbi:MAG: PAS domain-containing protein [Nitrospirota bacterium]|nr:PAS domain-containing protein [Nitrospirota bacterium]
MATAGPKVTPGYPNDRHYSKLPALIFLLGLVAVLSGYLALQYLETKMVETAGNSMALASADIADKLDRVLFERYSDSKVMAKAMETYLLNRSALTTYLDTVQQSYPVYLWIAATDRAGTIVAATDPASIGQDRSQQDWFLAVRDGNTPHVRDVTVSADGGNVPAVAFTAPIITLQEQFLGVVTSRVGLPVLEDAVVRTIRAFQVREGFFGHLEYQLLTESGDVFVDSLKEQAGPINLSQLGLPSAQLFLSGKPGYIIEHHFRRHVPVLTGYAQTEGYGRFHGLNWGVLVRLDLRDVLAPIRRVQWILGGIAAAILFPLMGFLLWSSIRLRREWADAQTQRVRAEEAEQKLRDIVEHSTNLFYAHAGDHVMTYLSPQARAYVGCDPSAVPVAWTEFLTDNPVNQKGLDLTRQAIETGQAQPPYELELKAKDGRTLWVAVHEAPVVRDGKTVAVVGSLTDITERKRAEVALQKSEARLQAILDFSPVMIFLKDSTGRYLQVNRQFERVFHVANDDIVGKTDAEVFPSSQAAAFHANDCKVIATGGPLEFEEVALHDDGPHTSIVCKFPLCDTSGKPYAIGGIVTDITARKWVEELQSQLLDKVIMAQEEERRRIARELHDETEQALASLLIGLRTMEEAPTLEEARQRVSELRRVAAQSLDELQRLVLGLRPSLLDELGLAAALHRLCTEFAQTHGIRVDLHVGSLDGYRLPSSTETALYRIVQEALANTAKHAGAAVASVLVQITAPSVRIVLEDNGCGFDLEAVRQSAVPTGCLGIYGMQERTAILGGTFTIESARGQGTTIYVEIPLPA